MALAVWLEWRRAPLSDSVELRRVRALLGLAQIRSSLLLSSRLERVEKSTPKEPRVTPEEREQK
jgi:hypothetical protein